MTLYICEEEMEASWGKFFGKVTASYEVITGFPDKMGPIFSNSRWKVTYAGNGIENSASTEST